MPPICEQGLVALTWIIDFDFRLFWRPNTPVSSIMAGDRHVWRVILNTISLQLLIPLNVVSQFAFSTTYLVPFDIYIYITYIYIYIFIHVCMHVMYVCMLYVCMYFIYIYIYIYARLVKYKEPNTLVWNGGLSYKTLLHYSYMARHVSRPHNQQ